MDENEAISMAAYSLSNSEALSILGAAGAEQHQLEAEIHGDEFVMLAGARIRRADLLPAMNQEGDVE